MVLYTEERSIWQKRKCKDSGGNKDTLMHISHLRAIVKTRIEEDIWISKLHKPLSLNRHVSEANSEHRRWFWLHLYLNNSIIPKRISQL